MRENGENTPFLIVKWGRNGAVNITSEKTYITSKKTMKWCIIMNGMNDAIQVDLDVLLVKMESILNLITLLEEAFAMSQNIQGESVMRVLKLLLTDLDDQLSEFIE